MDHSAAPHISGKLHAVLLDNEGWDDLDQVYIKHYANRLYLNSRYAVDRWRPAGRTYSTMQEACQNVWDGARIGIYARLYKSPFLITTDVQIFAVDGKPFIGTTRHILIKPQAKINLSGTGAIRGQ